MERFDVIVIGMGPGGEAAAGRLLDAGRRVAVVERELIGGECAYWACIPSKTLLRGPEARAAAGRYAGVSTPTLNWPGLRDYRDYMIRHLDDAAQVRGYEQAGATVIKGPARLAGRGRVEAGGEVLEADHIVIATGSEPVRPPVEGLDTVTVWTNREATTVRDIPARVLLIGGSSQIPLIKDIIVETLSDMGITKERVRQLNVRIMNKLRVIAREHHLEG